MIGLSPSERLVLEALRRLGRATTAELSAETGLPEGTVRWACNQLPDLDRVVSGGGRQGRGPGRRTVWRLG